MPRPIRRLLIANRGEIAIRIARSAADAGIETVAVASEDDAGALHTLRADRAVTLNGRGAAAYLDRAVALCRRAGFRRVLLRGDTDFTQSAYLDRYAQADKGWTDRDESRWPVPYWDIDTGFAALLMHLSAVDQGLGSCFFGLPAETVADFKAAFGVPEEYQPIGTLTVGYRAPDKRSPSLKRGRRPVDEVVHHGRWAGLG